jgi:hypothetical protein
MMSSLSLLAAIIMVEAGPVMTYLRIDRYGGRLSDIILPLVVSGILVVSICVTATIVPLRLARRRIESMEW